MLLSALTFNLRKIQKMIRLFWYRKGPDPEVHTMKSYKQGLEAFLKTHTYKETEIGGHRFRYLFCGHGSRVLALFVGGLGRQELWFPYVNDLEKDYRILTFNYPDSCRTNKELLAAIHGLMESLGISSCVVTGSSFGGYLAQQFVRSWPEMTEALILFSTAAFSRATLTRLRERYPRTKRDMIMALLHLVPYPAMKPVRIRLLKHSFSGVTEEERIYMDGLLREIYRDYTAREDIHLTGLFFDLLFQKPAGTSDYLFLGHRILLRLPADDTTFSPEMQADLVRLMPGAVLDLSVTGGHMATMMKPAEYADAMRQFLEEAGLGPDSD